MSHERTRTVAVIGAGNMGGAMAARLASLGWRVVVRDIDPARCDEARQAGARIADSARAAAAALEPGGALIVAVVDAPQVRDVLFGPEGAAQALQAGQAVLLCPTIAPEDVESVAADLAERGIACIDAPMSGGPVRAREGRMSLLVAAAPEVVAAQRPLLDALSQQVFVVSGRPGDGARTKLVNNLLAGINLVGAAEAMALAERMGLDLDTTLGVIEHSSGQSWIGSDRMRRAIAGDFAPRAHMTLLEKDTRLAVAAAERLGFAGPLGAHAAQAFERASAAGYRDLDDAALLSWLRDLPTMRP